MIDQKQNESLNGRLNRLYRESEKLFLDHWQKAGENRYPQPVGINTFGIIDPMQYDTDNGVLFVGRELNGWKDEDLQAGWTFCRWMRQIALTGKFPQKSVPNMWYNIGRWAMLIEQPDSDLQSLAGCKGEALAALGRVAFTNVNKVWGGGRADTTYYRLAEDRDVLSVLREEIMILKPKLIICCGTESPVKKALSDDAGRLIGMPHPAARMGTVKMLARLQTALFG